jgi:hypothetical protein
MSNRCRRRTFPARLLAGASSSAAPAWMGRRPSPRQTRPCRGNVRDGVPHLEAAQQCGVEVVKTRPVLREEQPVNPFRRVEAAQVPAHLRKPGHTSAGCASMVFAWLVKMCGCATSSSPGIHIRRSSAVEPARRPRTCIAPYPTSTDPRTYQPIRAIEITSKTGSDEPAACAPSSVRRPLLNLVECGADHAPKPSAAQSARERSWLTRPTARVAGGAPRTPPLPRHPVG